MSTTKQIFFNQTVNGQSDEIITTNGDARVKLSGNFGGGSVFVQVKTDHPNDVYSDTGDEFVSPAIFDIVHTPNMTTKYRLDLRGAAGASLNAFVVDRLG